VMGRMVDRSATTMHPHVVPIYSSVLRIVMLVTWNEEIKMWFQMSHGAEYRHIVVCQ
jgi:hypothetical protein